jgi:hypothetical protein
MVGRGTNPERSGRLSDGVFAIAITIMILGRTLVSYLRAVPRHLGASKRIG